jgi:hypothetical protein
MGGRANKNSPDKLAADLTLYRRPLKSNPTVFTFSGHYYARWRDRALGASTLRETLETAPPEKLLQSVWQQQRLRRDQLTTLDGEAVRVLHPGFKNREAGPDFRGAVVQFANGKIQSGDVELDLAASGWRSHAHEGNPAFKNVILHVIWDGERAASGKPTVALLGKLDAPLSQLYLELGSESADALPESLQGKCAAPLRDLPADKLTPLLHQAAKVRFQSKAARLQARAKHCGWEQSLWEGIFRALGYKQNIWPMQSLAESLPQNGLKLKDAGAWQARLFGLSGLLPDDLSGRKTAADVFVQGIWDQWWRERDEFVEVILPRELWRFNNLRPANHPQRRLALAAHWLASQNFTAGIERWFTTTIPDKELADSLLEVLQVKQDEFWSWHWTLRSAKLSKPQPLLGEARSTDLAINVILPWLWTRAVEGKNQRLQQVAEHRYLAWPSAEDNSALKLARQRLLGGAKASLFKDAAAQQGLLQIVRDFCEHSNALCDNCRFPELVRGFGIGTST